MSKFGTTIDIRNTNFVRRTFTLFGQGNDEIVAHRAKEILCKLFKLKV